MKETKDHFETIAVHAGVKPDPSTGAIMTPIFATSTYVQVSPGKHQGYDYSRTHNPTRTALETSLAALEGGKHALALSSGCTGTDVLTHLLEVGDHVVSVDDVYGGTSRLFRTIWARHGVETTFADLTQRSLQDFVTPKTKMVWIETPTNPLLKIIDIEKVVQAAKRLPQKPIVVVDNTFASPYFQSPLDLGADVVLHSTTKYINGHSDVVGGALITNDKGLLDKLHHVQNSIGGVPGPFDAFLVLRGIKTLALRMQRHGENAFELAKFLENHPLVERVLYPGLESHPQHAVAKRQMKGYGGMITFFIKGNLENARKFLESVRLFALAESLGGVESLVDHPAIMTHASIPAEMRKSLGITDTLIRLSVGIEALDDLKADLDQALKRSL
ncbi:MAG: PLP-dependent transferase [Deltaproteobacteria bacterium]|nr:PLP-dependent transferase [Deltaproteobacteria bacterium]MBM4317038.1 PLP-dependent transferase [Deltaproteobacteria bacterium]